ncbi:MAG: hypothetical protein ABGX32_07855 [Methylococcales bacterium]
MSLVTVTEAIALSGKSASTLYRHLKTGKLSKASDGSGRIDTSELLRVYETLHDTTKRTTVALPKESESLSQDNEWLKNQIEKIQQDMRDLKSESLDREKRLMALLEHKKESDSGLFGKLFK